jgi:hypothetical protein
MVLVNAIKFCHFTSDFNGKDVDRLCIVGEAEETRRAACQNLGGNDLLEFLECYTGPHISMLIFLQFSMSEWIPVTPIKALQITSAEKEFEGDSGTFCFSHGKKVNLAEQEEDVTLRGTGRKREEFLTLETCHKSSRLQRYQTKNFFDPSGQTLYTAA